ncbi:MAG: peptide deformylase [Candidatus Poseidoniales archaeon]
MIITNFKDLRVKSERFDFETENATELYEKLRDAMCENKGIGLSAIQIGIAKRVFVVGDPDYPDEVMPFFNPNIVDVFGNDTQYEEGCLSFPGLFLKVKRPDCCRVRYANINGDIETNQFKGITSRVIQHEFDHLEGILYTTKTNKLYLDQARRKQKKMNRMRKKVA